MDLPKDLLHLVLKGLIMSDYVRFSAVCKSWHSLAKENQKEGMSKCHHHHQPPTLMISIVDEENSWRLYNAMDDKLLDVHLRVPNKRLCGSSQGWLIFVDTSYTITLLNPFSSKVIHLPRFRGDNCLDTDYYAFKASLSADPIVNAKDCILMVISGGSSELACIRPSTDSYWTYFGRKSWGIEEVVYYQGKIYAIHSNGRLLCFDVVPKKVLSFYVNKPSTRVLAEGLLHDGPGIRYLVHLNGEFWMVKRYIEYVKHERQTKNFKVFKMNFDERRWIEQKTLGHVALFIGDNSSFSVAASDFPGCRPNCIYFTHSDDCLCHNLEPYGPTDCGVYDMTNHRFLKPYADDAKKLLKLTRRPSIWVVPTFHV